MAGKAHPALSEREQQILNLAAQGLIDTAIAKQLGISEATVSTYWGRVRVKLGPFSRTELVAIIMKEEGERAIQALKKENEELSNRLRLESGTYKSDSSFYRDLLDIAADAMFIVNSIGVIERANESATNLFGYEKGELDGEKVALLMPERFRQIHNQHRDSYLNNPSKRNMGEHHMTWALHKDGREFLIAATLSALDVEQKTIVICVVRPVV